MSASRPHQDASTAQARACAYGLLAHGFQYPDQALLDLLGDSASWSGWPGVLKGLDPALQEPLTVLQSAGHGGSTGECPTLASLIDLSTRLFGHAVRGKCPPYELEYGRSEIIQQASELADLAGFYSAFGVQLADDAERRPDHVSAECEFMAVLCAKQAHAIEENQTEHLEVVLSAQRSFLKDHLGQWIPSLAYRVQQADPHGFYGALASFADRWIKSECHRADVLAGPEHIELRPIDEVLDTSISCQPGLADVGSGNDEFVPLNVDSSLGRDS